jgi:tetratricopeptide (TPR) repeat protein
MMKIQAIFETNQQLTFLAGSGISVDPPSCQPTGYALTKGILSQLVPTELAMHIPHWIDAEGSHFLRFEELMTFVQRFDPNLLLLDSLGRCARPNGNHIALARLIKSGHIVFTTNFDSLIEHGLVDIGIPSNMINPIISRADWQSASRNGTRMAVFKLHGSVLRVSSGTECRDSIQATIRQIGRAKSRAISLEPWKQVLLEAALQAHDLVVIGYSGLDDFDIVPALRAVHTPQRLIWIEHSAVLSLADAKVDTIGTTKGTGQSNRFDRMLSSFVGSGRENSAVIRVSVNTGDFLNWLSDYLGCERASEEVPGPFDSRGDLSLPDYGLTEAEKWYVAGELCTQHDPTEAYGIFSRALEIAKYVGDTKLMGQCENCLGQRCHELLQCSRVPDEHMKFWHEGLEHYARALRLAESSENLNAQATALGNIGGSYLSIDTRAAARRGQVYFERALLLHIRTEDQTGQAQDHNHLGLAAVRLGDVDSAIRHFTDACDIDRALGSLPVIGADLASLGQLLCDNGEEAGVRLLVEAIEVQEALGRKDGLANCLACLGSFYASRQRMQEALDCYERALISAADASPELQHVIRDSLINVRVAMNRIGTGR